MLAIIEGPDCAGKTTLAKSLSLELNIPVDHHGPYLNFVTGYELAGKYLESIDSGVKILDRCWYSEWPYALVKQRPNRLTLPRIRILEEAAIEQRGVVVLCLPRKSVCIDHYKEGDEYLDNIQELSAVYDLYRSLSSMWRIPTITYDWKNMDSNWISSQLHNLWGQ